MINSLETGISIQSFLHEDPPVTTGNNISSRFSGNSEADDLVLLENIKDMFSRHSNIYAMFKSAITQWCTRLCVLTYEVHS